jgi:hypothetical protein
MSLKICFFQVTSSEIKEYSDISVRLNKEYCRIHNYHYLEVPTLNTDRYAPQWSKIFQIKRLIETENYDYYFFLDADAIVINRDRKLEDIIKEMKTNIAFSENGENGGRLINTGSFISNRKTLSLFNKCINLSLNLKKDKRKGYWHEQDVINDMYDDGWKMDVFPMNTINSYWAYNLENNDDQFIYHFMARPVEEKTKIAKLIEDKLKNKYNLSKS